AEAIPPILSEAPERCFGKGRTAPYSLSALGAERAGVRWGIPERSARGPTSPSQRSALSPSLSPLKSGEGTCVRRRVTAPSAPACGAHARLGAPPSCPRSAPAP